MRFGVVLAHCLTSSVIGLYSPSHQRHENYIARLGRRLEVSQNEMALKLDRALRKGVKQSTDPTPRV